MAETESEIAIAGSTLSTSETGAYTTYCNGVTITGAGTTSTESNFFICFATFITY